MDIPRHALVVVCDAGKALLLVNQGDPDLPDLRIVAKLEADDNPKTAEQGTDRPGRAVADSVTGTQRSAMEETDWHDRAEEAFARRLAAFVDKHHAKTARPPIIVTAPPRMLADLRRVLPHEVTDALIAEVDKDLVHLPTDALERALTA